MSRILITDGDQRSTLAVVRSLGSAGHEVLVCSASDRPLAGASRYCDAHHRVVDPATDPAAYASDIGRLIDAHGVDILLPMSDVSASVLLSVRETNPGVLLPFPSRETWDLVADKETLLRAASELEVPVPRQVVLRSPLDSAEAVVAAREIGLPLVVKPARSAVLTARGMRTFGVGMASTLEELTTVIATYPADAYPLLLQQHLNGPGLGAFLLCDAGRAIAAFGHRRLREMPPTGGVSVYRESVPLRQDVQRHAEAILQHFTWFGVAMVEFKEDAANGTPFLMEVNGRFWGSLQLAIDSGVDFPRLLVQLALGQEVTPIRTYAIGRRSRWFWGEVDHLLWLLRGRREARAADPTLPSRLAALARFVVPWRPGDRWEVLRLCDPKPFLWETLNWFRSLRS